MRGLLRPAMDVLGRKIYTDEQMAAYLVQTSYEPGTKLHFRAVLTEIGDFDHQTKVEMPLVEAENHFPLAL